MLYPAHCVKCGRPCPGGRCLCLACLRNELLSTAMAAVEEEGKRCQRCGRPLISALNYCISCRDTGFLTAIDRIFPLLSYHGYGAALLTSWKISGQRLLSEPFAEIISAVLSLPQLSGLPLVPVPPRPGKLRIKGWDQVEDLCNLLETRHHHRICRLLSRTGGRQQKSLGRLARAGNLKGYIRVLPGRTVPERVIVLDDLFTTGSTLETCASALKDEGCRRVYGVTLFYD